MQKIDAIKNPRSESGILMVRDASVLDIGVCLRVALLAHALVCFSGRPASGGWDRESAFCTGRYPALIVTTLYKKSLIRLYRAKIIRGHSVDNMFSYLLEHRVRYKIVLALLKKRAREHGLRSDYTSYPLLFSSRPFGHGTYARPPHCPPFCQ